MDSVLLSGKNNNVLYSDTVYADPNNPFCAGCYDFVIQLFNLDSVRDVVGVSSSSFQGNKYDLAVAYADQPDIPFSVAPDSATEGPGGKKITFNFNLPFLDETDPLIIYTNAVNDKVGSLTIATTAGETDPTAFVPAGPAVTTAATPEPSSLLLLGTGALGMVGMVRRRFVQA